MKPLHTMRKNGPRFSPTLAKRGICVAVLAALAACATRLDPAPVVDYANGNGAYTGGSGAYAGGSRAYGGNGAGGMANAPPPVSYGPTPPGYYRVKPGDTLYRIALDSGQNYRDVAAWNGLTDPNQIEVGQLLRVAPGAGGVNGAGGTGGAGSGISRNGNNARRGTPPVVDNGADASVGALDTPGTATVPPIYGGGVKNNGRASGATPSAPDDAMTGAAGPSGGIALAWPARGPILNGFDDSKNKGINIGGTAGEPVKAAGAGRVVYAGNGLRGYGNLVIIKHNATFLTAYAHNSALTVKEGEAVAKGQKIAEMGNSDADRVMLHFEVRRQGKPVDPLKYLPSR